MADNDAYVKLGLKKGDFDAGLKRAKGSLKTFEKDTMAIGRSLQAGFAAVIGSGVVLGMKSLLDAYAQQDKMERMLAAAMKEKNIYTEAAMKHNLNYASSLQQLTTFGDEEIMNAQRIFTNYRIEGEMLDKLTRATLDLAAAKEMDLKSAADLVAKSVGSSTNALSRYGVQIEGAVGSIERMQQAVDNITKLYGGTAAAAAETYEGKVIQLKNAFGDTQESLGKLLIGPADQLVSWLKTAVEWTGRLVTKWEEWSSVEDIGKRKLRNELDLTERRLNAYWPPTPAFQKQKAEMQAYYDKQLNTYNLLYGTGSLTESRRSQALPSGATPSTGSGGGAGTGGTGTGKDKNKPAFVDTTSWGVPAWEARRQAEIAENAIVMETDVAVRESTAAWVAAEEAAKNATKNIVDHTDTMSDEMKNAITGWGSHFASTLNDAVWDAEFSFSSIAESFGRMVTEVMIQKSFVEPFLGAVTGDGWDLFSGLFAKGGVIAYGKGGVVSRPTVFPMASGMGLMGEAGPEAVLPLARLSNGNLGVEASGGGNVEVNVYNNASGAEARVEQSTTASGDIQLDVIIDEIMAGKAVRGKTANVLKSVYGLRPTVTRR